MVRYIQKKLLGRMGCGLLMVMGSVGDMAHGSQNAAGPGRLMPTLLLSAREAGQKICGDPNGDTWYLQAVRVGNREKVEFYLADPRWYPNFAEMDRDGNTDLMLALKGGERDEWGANYREIFNLIAQRKNRNWNLQNARGQTALLLAVGWGRLEAIDALLRIDGVDPNIPNVNKATPLIAAIGNTFVPQGLRVTMASELIWDHRVNVNQRGTDNKLPLQIVFEAGLALQLANLICRKSLMDYDIAVKRLIREMLRLTVSSLPSHNEGGRLLPDQAEDITDELLNLNVCNPENFTQNVADHIDEVLNHRQEIDVHQAIAPHVPKVLADLVAIWNDPRINVHNYRACQLNQLVNAIRRKIHYLLTYLAAKTNLGDFDPQLRRIDANTQLLDNYLTQPNERNLRQLFLRLQ
jgi:hypothetical protein